MKIKVTVSIDEGLLGTLDQLVEKGSYDSRSAAMEAAITRLLDAQADARFDRALDAMTGEDWDEMEAISEEGMSDGAEQLADYPW